MYKISNLDDNGAQDITLQLPDAPVVGQAFSGDVLWTSQGENMVWQTLQNPVVQAVPGPNPNQWASYRIKGTRPDNNANIFFYLTDVTQSSGDMRMEVHAPNWSQRWFDQGVESWGNEYQHTFQLKGHWRFDAGGEDYAGSNNATFDGASITDGNLVFDGSDDFATISDPAELSAETWTISQWVKTSNASGRRDFFAKWYSSNGNYPSIALGTDGGLLKAYYRGDNKNSINIMTGPNIADNAWHNITYVKSSNAVLIYVDGAEVAQAAFSGTIPSTSDVILGAWDGSILGYAKDHWFDGTYDDLRIWSRDLSGTEVSALHSEGRPSVPPADIATGLSGRWSFDADASDSVGSSDGSASNVTFETLDGGGAATFSGSGGIDIPHSGDQGFDGTTTTVSAWFKTTQASQGYALLKAYGSGDEAWLVAVNEDGGPANKAMFFWRNRAGTTIKLYSTTNINDGAWHHISTVRDGKNLYLYVDGVLEDSATGATGTFDPTQAMRLGKWDHDSHPAGTFYTGSMDDVRVYSRALIAVDASALYDAGRDPAAPADISTGLVSRWSFESDASDSVGDNDLNMGNGAAADGVLSLPNYNSAAYPSSPIALGQSYTISIWFKNMRDRSSVFEGFTMLTGTSGGGGSNGSHAGNFASYDFSVYTNDELGVWSSGDNWVSSGYTMTYDNFTGWHNIVAAYSGEHTSFYIDGNKVGQDVQWGGSSDIETFGAWLNYNYTFAEELDDIRVYSRALSAVDASALYDAGRDPAGNGGGDFDPMHGDNLSNIVSFIKYKDSSNNDVYLYTKKNGLNTDIYLATDISDWATFILQQAGTTMIQGSPIESAALSNGSPYILTDANKLYKIQSDSNNLTAATEVYSAGSEVMGMRSGGESLFLFYSDGTVHTFNEATGDINRLNLATEYSADEKAVDAASGVGGTFIISRDSALTTHITYASSDWSTIKKGAEINIPLAGVLNINYYTDNQTWYASNGENTVYTSDISNWLA